LLLEAAVVPEFIQDAVTAERLAAAALGILENAPRAAAMRAQLGTIAARLGPGGATGRAASAILQEVGVSAPAALEPAPCTPSVA
jgi:lipid A disaccharide synthetase